MKLWASFLFFVGGEAARLRRTRGDARRPLITEFITKLDADEPADIGPYLEQLSKERGELLAHMMDAQSKTLEVPFVPAPDMPIAKTSMDSVDCLEDYPEDRQDLVRECLRVKRKCKERNCLAPEKVWPKPWPAPFSSYPMMNNMESPMLMERLWHSLEENVRRSCVKTDDGKLVPYEPTKTLIRLTFAECITAPKGWFHKTADDACMDLYAAYQKYLKLLREGKDRDSSYEYVEGAMLETAWAAWYKEYDKAWSSMVHVKSMLEWDASWMYRIVDHWGRPGASILDFKINGYAVLSDKPGDSSIEDTGFITGYELPCTFSGPDGVGPVPCYRLAYQQMKKEAQILAMEKKPDDKPYCDRSDRRIAIPVYGNFCLNKLVIDKRKASKPAAPKAPEETKEEVKATGSRWNWFKRN